MYKLLLIAAFAILTSFGVSTGLSSPSDVIEADTLKVLEPKAEHASEAYVISNLLKRFHYRKLELSDSISNVIFDNYFTSLDPNKAYFFDADIKQFDNLRYELDDQIPEGDLDFAYNAFELYRERALNRIDYVFEILDQGFDFQRTKHTNLTERNLAGQLHSSERDEIWRKNH